MRFYDRSRPLLACATALLLAAAHAGAVTIDFSTFPGPDGRLGTADDVPTIAPSTGSLTDEYKSLGVVFHPTRFETSNLILSSFDDPSSRELVTFHQPGAWGVDSGIFVTFTAPIYAFSFRVPSSSYAARLSVYDERGRGFYMESSEFPGGVASFSSAIPIAGFAYNTPFGGGNERPTVVAIDDLTFTIVPEPAAAATCTLAGLATLARRRRR